MATQLLISRNGGTGIAIDLPYGNKPPVSYKYSLESDDLSAFTTAYTTSINLPKTHTNCQAFNFPDNVGYGATDTVDKFTYTYSVDLEPSGTFTDYGKCVISSVTDTININLFSTLADFSTALMEAEWPTTDSYRYVGRYGSATTIGPNTDFQPCIATFDDTTHKGIKYTRSQFWNMNGKPVTTGGTNASNVFTYAMADIGIPNNSTCDVASIKNIDGWASTNEISSKSDFTFAQAPTISIPEYGYDMSCMQLKWYWPRLIIPLSVLFYNASIPGYTLSLSDVAKRRLSNLQYIGPRISDLTNESSDKSIKDFYTDDQHDTPNTRFGKFYTKEVLNKVEKPGVIIKRICKQFNLRLVQTSSTNFQVCTTEEFYAASQLNDISQYIDRSTYQVSPHAFKHSHIIFEGEAVESAVLKSYKDTTSYEFNRGKYATGYNVTSEKKWFGDSFKYATSYPHDYVSQPWNDKYTEWKVNLNCIGAYDSDAKEIDITGCVATSSSLRVAHVFGDVTNNYKYFDPYEGYYSNDAPIALNSIVAVGPTNSVISTVDMPFLQSHNFVYGEPEYKIAGQTTINLFEDTNGYNWFSDVKDSLSSSLVTTNVVFPNTYTDIKSVINKMYWFDNNYWVVWEIGSFIPGSKEPCEVTFLKVNDINNYMSVVEELINTVSIDHGSVVVTVNGQTQTNPYSFATYTGDSVEVSITASSGYAINTIDFNGSTITFTEPIASYVFPYTSSENSTLTITTQPTYSITASAGSGGSVSPTSSLVIQGGSATLIATPNDGYLVNYWVDNGVTTYTTNTEFTISNIQESHTVSVAFRSDACQLTVIPWNLGSSQVGGGKVGYTDAIHPSPTYSTIPITIPGHVGGTANLVQQVLPGYNFLYWQKSNHSYLSGSSDYDYTFSATSDTIYAAFADGTVYTWLVGATVGSGSGTCDPMSGQAAAGQDVTVVAQEATGSSWGGWYDSTGTTRLSTSRSYTFQMPSTQYYTIRPKFELLEGKTLGCNIPAVGTVYYSTSLSGPWTAFTPDPEYPSMGYADFTANTTAYVKYENIVGGVDYTDFSHWTGSSTATTTSTSVYMNTSKSIGTSLNTRSLTLNETTIGSVDNFIVDSSQYTPSSGSVTVSGMYAGKTYALNYTTTSGWSSAGGWSDYASASRSYIMPKQDSSLTATPTYIPSSVEVYVSLEDGLADAGAQLYYSTDGQQTWTPHAGGTFPVSEGTLVYVKVVHEDDNHNSYVADELWTWGTSGQPTGQAIISNTVGSSGWYIGVCNATRFAFTAIAESGAPEGASVTCSISGTNYAGTSATITAIAPSGWSFEKWSDNNTSNPRTMRIPAATTTMQAKFVQRTELSEPTVSIEAGLISKSVKVNGNTVTSFPHQIYAGDTIQVDILLNTGYEVNSWTVNSSTTTSSSLSFSYTVPTPAVSVTTFRANLTQFKYVACHVLDSAPSGSAVTAYYTLSGTQYNLSIGTESDPVYNHVPISASSITTVVTPVLPYVNESCLIAEDQSGIVEVDTLAIVNQTCVISQNDFLGYPETFNIIPQYSSATTTKHVDFSSTVSPAPSGLSLSYKVNDGAVTPWPSGGIDVTTNSSVTLYYTRASYADAYQWFEYYQGQPLSHIDNDNQQSYTFTVTYDIDIRVSTKQVTIYFAENPDPSAFSGAILFSIGGTDVTQYSGYEGDSVIVTARSGNAYFNGWTDGASNPRTIAIPHSSTTYYANYLEAYTVQAVTTSIGSRVPFASLSMTIQVPGGSAVEYDPTVSHANIPVNSSIVVTWSLTQYYQASSWQGSSVPASSPSTFTMPASTLNLTLIIQEWYHVYGLVSPAAGGSLASFSYSTDSGSTWTSVGIPTALSYVSVPVDSLVKLDCSGASGYIFSEWQLDGTTLAGSGYVQNYTWDTSVLPPQTSDAMITAVFSGGTSWDGLKFSPVGASSTIYLEYYQNTEGTVPIPDCEYSTDGTTWTAMPKYQAGTPVGTPLTFTSDIYVRGLNTSGWYQGSSNSYGHKFIISGNTYASGNIMSLIGQTSTAITTIPNVRCFCRMFYGCTALASMPTLNATNVTQYCYYRMFQNCIGLTSTSSLPAINPQSANNSCSYMFNGCSNLTEINAGQMLHTASTVTATNYWVQGVAASGTFYAKTGSVWPTASNHAIPSGWTRQDV